MKKANLLKLAEGFKTISEALFAEAEQLVAGENVEVNTVEAEEKTTPKSTSKPADKVTEPAKKEKEAEPVEDAEGDELYTEAELKTLKADELKAILDEYEVKYKVKASKPELIKQVLEAQEEAVAEDAEDADVEEADTAGEEAEEDTLTIQDIVDIEDKDELLELAGEYEIKIKLPAKKSVEDIQEILIGELFDEDEIEAYNAQEEDDSNEDEGEEDGEELTPEDLDGMSLAELKELATEYEVKFPKMAKAQQLRDILKEELFEDEDAEDADEGEDDDNEEYNKIVEEYGLDELEIEELAEILTDHELPAKGKKQALIDRIVKAVQDGTIEGE